MSQQWLSVIGLTLDFAGFCLLLMEWWLAFFNEEYQLGASRRLEDQQRLRAFSMQHSSDGLRKHMEVSGRMQDDAALRQARTEHKRTMARRKRAFVVAAVLIVVGFVLQVAGSWPGCCLSIGILPQG